MSARHRQTAPTTGKVKLAKDDRRGDRRRERHASKSMMKWDADSVGSTAATRHKEAPKPERTPAAPAAPSAERFRHWKEPFWKRRKLERHRRNELLTRAEKEGLPIELEEEKPGPYDVDPYAHLYADDEEVSQESVEVRQPVQV